ncbi:MAG: 4-hydroxythreonine-4-phosphate dehydrogenase PdxA [Bifidobacteriaceae bacterium]|jgi:4-hydroxythreonine-4-phosphate dehydrogenase|nr:4-hydroxythreonine-4-phosphate dehydrogenase PdxA [Bifidobacteriaceae bacterium]
MTLPLIAVTMGDAAGVGPEVTVAACLDPEVLARCRPVVIGDAGRLRQALTIMGLAADVDVVAEPAQAEPGPGHIAVVDLGGVPDNLPWGQLSAAAGEAAYRYIERAATLASARQVAAICTAPINKAAIKLAGHNFPGHTELLAHLTGTPEVSMMLATDQLRVIHVTTHVGLADAIAQLEPGRVYRTIKRGHEALARAGLTPRIGVCAVNPHAGENGLFGHGEEERQIAPGVAQAEADGIDVKGPLPADSLFYLAVRGDFDLVVAMYHDQGHCPIKVLGFEAGVNITVGLPVIRTSVDHGTAFDIAGRGLVNPSSMIEAMRQATLLAAAV